jgi:tRNA nucleotidyltransferase (CCA-adding enzyme)
MNVEPSLPIYEAVLQAHGGHFDFVGYVRDGLRHVAHRDDLHKMASMGLDTLPVECIAIPETSPLLHGERSELSAKADYSRRLTQYFPVYFVAALYELQSLILKFGAKGYVIGGITRDLLLYNEKRLAVRDVDITIEGDAIALSNFLMENSRNFQVLERYPEFGTAKMQYKESLMFDVASTREEVYPHCGALPMVVKRGVPLVNDVIRRDFTINALAFSIHELGHVLDYSNGIRDIEMRQIRVLHPVSFFEDPSRILRALKFCARFDFELAEETRRLLERFLQYGGRFYKGGGERIKQELKGLLGVAESDAKRRCLRLFLESGCYRLLNMETPYQHTPEAIERLDRLSRLLPIVESSLSGYLVPDFLFDIHLCFLFGDMPSEDFQKTSQRLGLTKAKREAIEHFRKLKPSVAERFGTLHEFASPVEIYDLFHGLPFITVIACILELGFDNQPLMKTALAAFATYKRKWEKLHLALDGNDLIDLGVPEGRAVGQLLDELLHVKLAGRLPDRLDEIQYVQNHLQAQAEAANPAPESVESTEDRTNSHVVPPAP